jgi:hypothetical protein
MWSYVSTGSGHSDWMSFSVVYAIILMIWLETPIVNDNRFKSCIQLYKRFIDVLFVIWTGPVVTLCELRMGMGKADPNISLDWTGYDSQEAATDPMVVKEREHGQVHFMDRTCGSINSNSDSNTMDSNMWDVSAALRTVTTFRVLFRTVNLAIPTPLRVHPLQFLSRSTCLPRMDHC